jgi:hypothetical protein
LLRTRAYHNLWGLAYRALGSHLTRPIRGEAGKVSEQPPDAAILKAEAEVVMATADVMRHLSLLLPRQSPTRSWMQNWATRMARWAVDGLPDREGLRPVP